MSSKFQFSLFGLFIFLPVTISILYGGGIGLNRVGGFDNVFWMFSFPISVFFGFFVVVSNLNKILRKRFILFFTPFLLLCFLLKTIYNVEIDYTLVKTITVISMFVFLLFAFEQYFEKKINIDSNMRVTENQYVLYPLIFILIASIISWHFSYDILEIRGFNWENEYGIYQQVEKGVPLFLHKNIVIYDFEQYFAIVFLLMIASATRLNLLSFLILFVLAVYLAKVSTNITALALMMFLFFYYVLYRLCSIPFCRIYDRASIIFFVSTPILYLLFMYFLYEYFGIDSVSFKPRHSMINSYFSNLEWYQVIFPFLGEVRKIGVDMHNEFLEIFNATSLLGIISIYYIILKKLSAFGSNYRTQRISIILIIFFGGLTVENTLHPYTSIILAYCIAFYYVLSKKEKRNKLFNHDNQPTEL